MNQAHVKSATAHDTVPQRYTIAIRVWVWINMGQYHHRDSGAYPQLCYSIVSCHHHRKRTHSTGAYTESLLQASVDQPRKQQKVEQWIFAGTEVASDGGLQKVVGRCHGELQILYKFIMPHRVTRGKRILERSTVTYV